MQAFTAQVHGISHFLHFSFWVPAHYKVDGNEPDHKFPSQSDEKRGDWVGLLTTKVINVLGRYSLMKLNR